MKVHLTTFNAKYIHTSMALRWLYVVNKDRFDLSFSEYTIKESVSVVADNILEGGYDVVGISVSIWNVKQSRELAKILKEQNPDIIIITGGPEVSYEPQFFINNWDVDYVVSGEGEFVLGQLLDALQKGNNLNIDSVSSKYNISYKTAQADITELIKFPSPYRLEFDNNERRNRITYFETSRGCPYFCQYCLSSLEKGVRYFPGEYIVENLKYLIDSDVKQIKFLDRTFNLNKKNTMTVFDFLIENHRPGLNCQFEIYADLLNDETIEYLNSKVPKNYFRFEIGIQSTHEPTNVAVKRNQNFSLLSSNIEKIMKGDVIDLHLDLIAGLPFETFDRFRKSFNDVFRLRAKEVQLGFLKLLRGTNLRRDALIYGYKFYNEAPYEIISGNDISEVELERIRDVEEALDKFWNSGRFASTMNFLFEGPYFDKYFDFFDEMGHYYKVKNLPRMGYQLEDLFNYLDQFLKSKGIDACDFLREDYYSNFKIRPTGYWSDDISKAERKKLLYTIGQDKDFLSKHNLTRKIIEKQTAINPLKDGGYLLTIFFGNKKQELVYF
ncbi:MAG TPA: B12-binding domain-containing radical SAM protein [Fermentimonas caenicola]|jgi:anaerobic magnesium-protoporphyrin IX monomethyl ester cyclase|nr:MAG: B12-binding domain-containing radical SAM protein [Fermentimonas caenicola]HHU40850.1 B12-binding domain-containing radical SAM protein [Fermentimonas caenicola]